MLEESRKRYAKATHCGISERDTIHGDEDLLRLLGEGNRVARRESEARVLLTKSETE